MASFRETRTDYSATGLDEEDIRSDGKKKKFKPLSAVRKLFGKRRKKEEGEVVAVKARSTTALHNRRYEEDDDDDGGFKSHQPPASLAKKRSISEDSVFSPEAREATVVSLFPKSAVSEESLPKSTFQSELLSKLNKRRSQYSDDDRDDGLPQSPVPPVTTADVINTGLKSTGGYKKSVNRDSDQSLISVDSSDNEEDLFHSKWKTSVHSKKSHQAAAKMSDGEELDFSQIEKTELLTSSAARDRIAIKPRARRASRVSTKRKEVGSLPSLNEESPSKDTSDKTSRDSWFADSTESKEEHSPLSKSAPGYVNFMTSDRSPPASPTNDKEAKSTSTSATKGKITDNKITPSSQFNARSSIFTKNHESRNIETAKPGPENTETVKPSFSIKSRTANFESPDSRGASNSHIEATPKASDIDSSVKVSPKESYKQKREGRSKTLPGGNEQSPSPSLQRAASHRLQNETSAKPKEKEEAKPSKSEPVKKLDVSRFSMKENISTSQTSWMRKRNENDEKTENSSSKIKSDAQIKSGAMDSKSASTVSISNSSKVFQNTSNEKRGSIDTSPLKAKDTHDVVKKNDKFETKQGVSDVTRRFSVNVDSAKRGSIDAGWSKRPSIDAAQDKIDNESIKTSKNDNNTNKRPSIDIGSVRRESIEINVSELSSVEAKRKSFSSKPDGSNNVAKSWANKEDKPSVSSGSTFDKAKMFGSTATTNSQMKESKPANLSFGQNRTGSVQASPTKQETPAFQNRSAKNGTNGSQNLTHSKTEDKDTNSESQHSVSVNRLSTASKVFGSASSKSPHSQNISQSSTSTSNPATPFSSKLKPVNSFASASVNVKSGNVQSVVKPVVVSSSSLSSSKSSSVTVRSHSSFSTSPFSKPQLTSTTAISKTPSLRNNSITTQKPLGREEKDSIPAWRANLQKKDVKIEIIEKQQTGKTDIPAKSENNRVADAMKKPEINTATTGSTNVKVMSDKASNRSSKVLDMVKSYQNLQVTT